MSFVGPCLSLSPSSQTVMSRGRLYRAHRMNRKCLRAFALAGLKWLYLTKHCQVSSLVKIHLFWDAPVSWNFRLSLNMLLLVSKNIACRNSAWLQVYKILELPFDVTTDIHHALVPCSNQPNSSGNPPQVLINTCCLLSYCLPVTENSDSRGITPKDWGRIKALKWETFISLTRYRMEKN